MAYISDERLKKVLSEFPDRESRAVALKQMIAKGHIIQGVNDKEEKKPGLISRAWDALAVPEQLSRKGLGMIASAVPGREPTGDMALDIGLNIPKVAAETMAEAAPSFISRGAIVTAGALKGLGMAAPLIRSAGSALAKGAEGISGLEYKTPGVLTEAAKDSSLLFGKGRSSVSKMYQASIDTKNVRPFFGQAMSHKELINTAADIAREGGLTPEEALIARKTLDAAKKEIPEYSYHKMRDMFDAIAKNVSKEADAAYTRAVKSEALRNLAPQNKLGGASVAKIAVGSLLGPQALLASPVVQGTLATGAGLASRGIAPFVQNPLSGAAMAASTKALQALRNARQSRLQNENP